jgi:hypothetical protein
MPDCPPPPPASPVVGGLRCERCGRQVELREDELIRYVRAGWPVCCGEIMTMVAPGGPPDRVVLASQGGCEPAEGGPAEKGPDLHEFLCEGAPALRVATANPDPAGIPLAAQRCCRRWVYAGPIRLGDGSRPADLDAAIATRVTADGYHLFVRRDC